MNFASLSTVCAARGAKVRNLGNGHWQIVGSYVVNFYPYTKKGPTVYVAGMSKGRSFKGDAKALVDLAFSPPRQRRRAKRKRNKDHKVWLFRRRPVCYWCGKKLTALSESRLDHKIPFSAGGSEGHDNLVLACVACDVNKGDKMPDQVTTQPAHADFSLPDPTATSESSAAVPLKCAIPDESGGSVVFTVVGFVREEGEDKPFTRQVYAKSWHDAVCDVRDELGDINHTRVCIVSVVYLNEKGVMLTVPIGDSVIEGAIGRKAVANRMAALAAQATQKMKGPQSPTSPQHLLADFIVRVSHVAQPPTDLASMFETWIANLTESA